MASMSAGFATNIVLDYLFVWVYVWGMAGTAAATVIGQGVTIAATIIFFIQTKPGFAAPPLKKMLSIFRLLLKLAVAPFGLTFSPVIKLMLMNRFLMMYDGGNSVAVFACISYITSIVYLLLQGVGDGCQPLISRYYGENALSDMKRVRSLAHKTAALIASACMLWLFLSRDSLGTLFGASASVSEEVASILPMYLISMLFLSYVRVTTSYFYAAEKSAVSYALVYAEPLLLLALLFILPGLAGLNGVWLAIPLA